MNDIIIFNKGLNSKLHWYYIGEGAKVNLNEASYPLLCFIWFEYLKDETIISGDIQKLQKLVFQPKEIQIFNRKYIVENKD